jgi:type I restriction enzyme, S subunit
VKYSKYPSYKDSGVEWLGEIPEHWIKSKIKFTSSIFGRIGFRGYTTADIVEEGKGAITLSPSNMKNDKMVYTKLTYLNWDKYYESPEIQIKEEDVVFVKTGSTLGKVGYIETLPHEMTLNPQLIVFKKRKCHAKYLYYLLNTKLIKAYVDNSNNGGTIPTMTQESILNYEVPSCEYTEQQTIANYLDIATAKIDTLIEKQTKLIELLREKRQAVISTAVTRGLDNTVAMKNSGVEWLGEIPKHWEVWKMSHAFNTIGSGTTPTSTKESYYNGYIPWVTTGELRENTILRTKKLLTDEAIQDNSSLKLFPINSIIIAMYGATIGRLGVLGIKATTNQACCVMTDSPSIKNPYLYYWLMGYRDEIIKLGYGGGQPNISQDTISSLQVSAPSIKLQEKIINYLDDKTSKIDKLISKSTKAIDLLKEKRTALISSTVTGKIDVREVA